MDREKLARLKVQALTEYLGGSADGLSCVVNCPAHRDTRTSLHLTIPPEGSWQVICKQGCSRSAIVQALGPALDAAEDILDLLNGSSGLAAVVDGLLIMRRTRGQMDATLHVVHKDMDSLELALAFDAATLTWKLLGDAKEYGRSKERLTVLELLRDGGSMTPVEIADALGRNRSTVRGLLTRMKVDGEIGKVGERYAAGVEAVDPVEGTRNGGGQL